MKKQINFVYSAANTPVYYDGDEGTIFMSTTRNSSMPNVFFGDCSDIHPEDSVIILEPIVTTPSHYDLEYLSKFKYVFSWASKYFQTTKIKDKLVEINCGSELCGPKIIPRENIGNNHIPWISWDNKIDGVVIVSCNKQSQHQASIYKLREMLADTLYSNGYRVDWYGHQYLHKPYYKGSIPEKLQLISKYKFHICTENTYSPIFSHNYLTEKLAHCLYAGTVPLYMGAYNIDELLPKNSFVDLRNFVTLKDKMNILAQPLLEHLRTFSEKDAEHCREATRQTLSDSKGIFYHTDMDRCCRKILEVI